jgi:hypothetical protein
MAVSVTLRVERVVSISIEGRCCECFTTFTRGEFERGSGRRATGSESPRLSSVGPLVLVPLISESSSRRAWSLRKKDK